MSDIENIPFNSGDQSSEANITKKRDQGSPKPQGWFGVPSSSIRAAGSTPTIIGPAPTPAPAPSPAPAPAQTPAIGPAAPAPVAPPPTRYLPGTSGGDG